MNIEINEYITLAVKHGDLILSGDSKKANKVHQKLIDKVEKIKNSDR